MLLLDGIVLGVILSLATGGRFGNLAQVRLKGETAIFVLLIVQLLIPRVASFFGGARAIPLLLWLLIMTAMVALAFMNWRSVGMVIAGFGIALNILAIAANGAMPVSTAAIASLNPKSAPRFDIVHEPTTDKTRLLMLSDVIAIPGPPWHRGIASVGDLFLTGGAGLFVFSAMRKRVVKGERHRKGSVKKRPLE